jgi:3'-5' exoribonuclease
VAQPTEYHIEDYVPVSEKDNDQMFSELLSFIQSVGNQYLQRLLQKFFVEDEGFIKAFRVSSAAKNIHHSFVGGLLEHTLGVTRLCDVFTKLYPILKRDLLICAAIFHDIGKIKELSVFPENTYTDDGQLLGHIYIGTEMINHKASEIENFPHALLSQLLHCILAHHGKLEYGSPKVPALIEAIALFYADGIDAKLETFQETLDRAKETSGWLPYQRLFESGLRFTEIEEQIKEQIEE